MLVLSAAIARAEPAAMRELAQRDAAVSVGTRSSAVALGVGPVDVALDVGWDGLATGLYAGTSRKLIGDLWQIDGGIAGGLLLLPFARTVGAEVVPWVGGGIVGGRGTASLRLVAPSAVAPVGARISGFAELTGGLRAGPAWVTPRAGLGAVYTPGLDVSMLLDAGIVVSASLP